MVKIIINTDQKASQYVTNHDAWIQKGTACQFKHKIFEQFVCVKVQTLNATC